MKKTNLALVGLYLVAGTIAFIASSCKKDEVVSPISTVPGISIISVTSANVTLNNQKSASDQKYVVSTKTFASNSNFDFAYGNGTASSTVSGARLEATSNLYFIGGPKSESIYGQYGVYGTVPGVNATEFYTVADLTAAKFDTLVNKLAIYAWAVSAVGTGAESTGGNYRIKSSTPWPIGSTFAIKLSDDSWVLAKTTSLANGSSSTAGTVSLTLKY